MSKNLHRVFIIGIILCIIFPLLYFILGTAISAIFVQTARDVLAVALGIVLFVVEAFVVAAVLFYWWADEKWKKIKNRAKKCVVLRGAFRE